MHMDVCMFVSVHIIEVEFTPFIAGHELRAVYGCLAMFIPLLKTDVRRTVWHSHLHARTRLFSIST